MEEEDARKGGWVRKGNWLGLVEAAWRFCWTGVYLLTVGFYADWVAGAKASCPEDAAGGKGAEGCC